MKDLRRAMKIKFGNEKEKLVDGFMNYGFNVKLKYINKTEEQVVGGDDDDL